MIAVLDGITQASPFTSMYKIEDVDAVKFPVFAKATIEESDFSNIPDVLKA